VEARGHTTAWAAIIPGVFLAGLALVLATTVFGEIALAAGTLHLRVTYKTLARLVPLAWLALLALPRARAGLPYRPASADLPLALFAGVAALSVLCGGGHWGDVRTLAAAIGIGVLARSLFGDPARQRLLLHYLGWTVVLIVARERATYADLVRAHELARYGLVTANPNVLGFLFAMVTPLFLAETIAARGPRRIAAAGYLLASLGGTLVTFSRTAVFGLALGTLIVALCCERRRQALLASGLLLAAILAAQRPDLWTHTRHAGDIDRLRIMHTSLTLAMERPVLGIGFGINNLEERFPARYEELYGTRLFRFHSANVIVDLLVGTGLVGTGLALWWAGRVGAGTWRRVRAAPSGAVRVRAAGNLAALAAIAAMSLAEPPLSHGKLLPVLFLVLAYVELPVRDEPDRDAIRGAGA